MGGTPPSEFCLEEALHGHQMTGKLMIMKHEFVETEEVFAPPAFIHHFCFRDQIYIHNILSFLQSPFPPLWWGINSKQLVQSTSIEFKQTQKKPGAECDSVPSSVLNILRLLLLLPFDK